MVIPNELVAALKLAQEKAAGSEPEKRFASELAELLASGLKKLAERPARASAQPRAAEYIVEESSQGEALAEHRLSGKAKPFRAKKDLFDQLVNVLETSDRLLSVDEIADRISARSGSRTPEFTIRMLIRFLMTAEPPICDRAKAKYRPADFPSFRQRCEGRWNAVRAK